MNRRRPDGSMVRMAAAVGVCLLTGAPLIPLNGHAAAVYALLSSTALALVAAGSCTITAVRAPGRSRRGWLLVALGCLSWGLGNLYWSHNELIAHAEVLFPSLADLGFVIFPIAAGAGLWLISGRSKLGPRLAPLLDGLIVTGSLFVVSWALTLRSVWEAGADSTLAFVVSLAYPIGDLVLATMAFLLAVRTRYGTRTVAALLITGLLGMAASDTLFALGTARGTYVSGAFSDAGWVVAFAALALAGRWSARQPMSLRDGDVVERWQLILPYLPFLIAGVISVLQILNGQQVDGVQAVALQLIFVLILGRQLVTVVRNSTLTTQLRFQAYHDPLTGLGNRALFTERLDEALAVRRRTEDSPAVLFLDLDDFKLINDTLGHDAGDTLLRAVADRMRSCFPSADTVARLGGDEFAVLLLTNADPAAEAQRILEVLRPPFTIGTQSVAVTASVGIAGKPATPGAAVRAEDLRKHVDLAMYAAKAKGKNAYAVFEPAMRDVFDSEMTLRDELGKALQDGSLYVVYQPIVGLGDQRVAGLEALARWRHPTMGEVPPATFIPVAERAGMVADIGLFVLDRACAEFTGWDGSDEAYLSVNVSPLQLLDPEFADRVLTTADRYGLAPHRLVLEITETALVEESLIIPALRRLRAAGMRIAIDDFGTGYSSLRYLHRFPADIVKIDRSYVQDIASDHRTGRLVETLWQMFSALGLAAVAEGVEDADQARLLQRMGCPMAQGYLFGRPARLPRASADVQDPFADSTAFQQVTVGVTGML